MYTIALTAKSNMVHFCVSLFYFYIVYFRINEEDYAIFMLKLIGLTRSGYSLFTFPYITASQKNVSQRLVDWASLLLKTLLLILAVQAPVNVFPIKKLYFSTKLTFISGILKWVYQDFLGSHKWKSFNKR